MLKFITLILVFGSISLLFQVLFPILFKPYETLQKKKAERAASNLEEMFIWVAHKRLILIFSLSPIILGIVFFILFGQGIMILGGIILGFVLPSITIKVMERSRKNKFAVQLLDALVSLSQSLKAGLSFLQALEVLIEEMPSPISQEFGIIVKENKMGKSLEESFERLNKRMNLEDLNLITTAILVARETGGNLTEVFSHLADSIRQKNKIAQQVKTLTTQARWQGVIMSALPVVFAIVVFRMNPNFFNIMLESKIGKLLLLWCVISEIIGAFMLNRLSRIRV